MGHILSLFEEALAQFDGSLAAMGGLALRNFVNAAKGIVARDESLCLQAIADDEEVEALQADVDRKGLELLLRFAPMATDLRHVIAGMRVAQHLESISSESKTLAKNGRAMIDTRPGRVDDLLRRLLSMGLSQCRLALEGHASRKPEGLQTLRDRDKELDAACRDFTLQVTSQSLALVERELLPCYLFISRAIERIGDCAKHIAEETSFLAFAKDVRFEGNGLLTDLDGL